MPVTIFLPYTKCQSRAIFSPWYISHAIQMLSVGQPFWMIGPIDDHVINYQIIT